MKEAYTNLLRKALVLLKEMLKENPCIQVQVYEQLDVLLTVKSCHKELADALIQVGYCPWYVTPGHVHDDACAT